MADINNTGTPGAASPAARQIIAAGPNDLVVLKACGKHTRMAKSILRTSSGSLATEPHDGCKAYHFAHARTEDVSSIPQAARAFSQIQSDEFVIRGALFARLPAKFRRLLHPDGKTLPTVSHVARSYVIFDIDGATDVPGNYHPSANQQQTETAVRQLIADLLPPEFADVSCWFGFTASHGIKPGMSLRLFFNLSRAVETNELKAWLGHLHERRVDPSAFSPAQQILIAPPILHDGMPDPVQIRSGTLIGRSEVVKTPTGSALTALNVALPPSPRLKKPPVSGGTAKPQCGRPSSYQQALRSIGDGADQNGIHNAILSAVGHWVRENGPNAQAATLISDINAQITHTVIDPTRHPSSYIKTQIEALPALIDDVMSMERSRRQSTLAANKARIETPVRTERQIIERTVEDAFGDVRKAADDFMRSVPALIQSRNPTWETAQQTDFGRSYPPPDKPTPWRKRCAILVDPGVGKTTAIIDAVTRLLAPALTRDGSLPGHEHCSVMDDTGVGKAGAIDDETQRLVDLGPDLRVAYVVPEHKLGDDVVARLNSAAGGPIAEVWRGLTQPDPANPDALMCPRSDDFAVVKDAGGDLTDLCGSSRRGFCRFHKTCGYRRQQQFKPKVWVVPAAMLTKAVPEAMRRNRKVFTIDGKQHEPVPPAFDLLVLDEAPFLSWQKGVDGNGTVVPMDWLNWENHFDVSRLSSSADREILQKAMDALAGMASALISGKQTLEAYYSEKSAEHLAGDDSSDDSPDFETAMDVLRNSLDRIEVNPELPSEELTDSLAEITLRTQWVRAIRQFMRVHLSILKRRAPSSSLQRHKLKDGSEGIRLLWKDEIHPSWQDNPILYLDATAEIRLAEQWLGKIETLVTAKAATPHMRILQVDDRPFGHRAIVAPPDDTKSQQAGKNRAWISDLMSVAQAGTGGTGLLIGPKEFVKQMTADGRIPEDWKTASFGSLRGVDAFKSVSVAIIVSRQLPSPAVVELMTEIAFGKSVRRLDGNWYPTTPAVRLMTDGTGRQSVVEVHPDEDVEAVRWAICEAEVLQAIGRVRGVRRDASNPVLVIVLNRVDLGDLPIAELLSSDDLSRHCGPTMMMAIRGCVPVMWSDVAAMVGRWKDAKDPTGSAKTWFRDNPEESQLRNTLLETGQICHPFSGKIIPFRKESLGLVGKHHRYVWLSQGVSIDEARAMLPPPINNSR